ncbi:hypothetical protein HBB16_15530 [Pseudonocardia sp. MCCB 268]|nr:hypothetical protein [Pseudonocardia cytotoxica]
MSTGGDVERPSWAPGHRSGPAGRPGCTTTSSAGRTGCVDRGLAEMIAGMTPNIGDTMRANRSFLRRGGPSSSPRAIDQFLDLGSGDPDGRQRAQVVRQADPEGG